MYKSLVLAVSAIAGVAFAQLPACANTCIVLPAACPNPLPSCICKQAGWINNVACCVFSQCTSQADRTAVINYANSICTPEGVTLPTSPSNCSANGTVSSTASGSGTSSGTMSMTSSGSLSSALASASSAQSSLSSSASVASASASSASSSAFANGLKAGEGAGVLGALLGVVALL